MIGGADGPTSIWLAGDAEDLTEEDRLAAFVQLWAAAAGNRNAEYVYESLSPELQDVILSRGEDIQSIHDLIRILDKIVKEGEG